MLPHKFKYICFSISIALFLLVITKFSAEVFFEKKIMTLYIDSQPQEISVKTTNEKGEIISNKTTITTTPNDIALPLFILLINIVQFIQIFSKEKIEDERIDKIRLKVFQKAFAISMLIVVLLSVLNIFSGKRIFDAGIIMLLMAAIYNVNYAILFKKEQACEDYEKTL